MAQYNPFTSPETLLQFANQARTAPSSGSNIVDPITGVTLDDFLLQQRASGVTPSFTNIPGQANQDTMMVESKVAQRMVEDQISFTDEQLNPEAATDSATAAKMKAELTALKKSQYNTLLKQRGEELGLFEMNDRINALRASMGATPSQHMVEYVNGMINQYNAKKDQVESSMTHPDVVGIFDKVDHLIERWDIQEKQLTKKEDSQLRVEEAGQKLETSIAVQAKTAAGTHEEILRMQELTGLDSKDVLQGVANSNPKVMAAKQIVSEETRLGRKLEVDDIYGRLGDSAMEREAIDIILDSKNMSTTDRTAFEKEVIGKATMLEAEAYSQLDDTVINQAVEKELARRNKGKDLDDYITVDKLLPDEFQAIVKSIPAEQRKRAQGLAKIVAYNNAVEQYKRKIVNDRFIDAMDLTGYDVSLEAQEASKKLIQTYPAAFLYPLNNSEAELNRFDAAWRKIGVEYQGKIALKELVNAMINKASRDLNAVASEKIPGETSIINGASDPIFRIASTTLLGKMDAVRGADNTAMGAVRSIFVSPFLSEDAVARIVGLSPEDLLQLRTMQAQQDGE